MAVVYLIFNEGYTATAGDDWMRPDLALEATRLARMLAVARARRAGGARPPGAARAPGLARPRPALPHRRAGAAGGPGPLAVGRADDPPRARRPRARLVARRARASPSGRYFLQASIAAEHARAARAADTDWVRIASLYDVLADAAPGPVVEVNRAVAHGQGVRPRRRARRAVGRRPGRPRRLAPRAERARRPARARGVVRRRGRGASRRPPSLTRNEGERALLRATGRRVSPAAGTVTS